MLLENRRFWSKAVNQSGVKAEQGSIRATATGDRNAKIPEIRTPELACMYYCRKRFDVKVGDLWWWKAGS